MFFKIHCLSLTFPKQNAETDLTLVEKTGWSKKRMRTRVKKDRDPPSARTWGAEGGQGRAGPAMPSAGRAWGQGLGFTANIDSFSNLFAVL